MFQEQSTTRFALVGASQLLSREQGASSPYICYMGRVFGEQPDPGANGAGPSVGQLPQGEGRGFGSWSCALSPWDGQRCGQGPLGVTLQGVEVMGVPQRAPRGASPRAMGIWGPHPHHGTALPAPSSDALPGGGAPCVPGHPARCHPAHAWQSPLDNHPSPKRGENSPGLCFSTNLPPEPGREDASLWALFPLSPLALAPCVSFSFDPGTPRGAAPAHQPHVRVGARHSPHSGRISPLHRAEVTCVRPRKCAKAPRIGSGP